MYILTKALVKARGAGTRWEEANLSNVTMNQIYAMYVAVFLILENTVTNETHAVDIRALPTNTQFSTLTLENWLIQNGNASLPIMDTIPTIAKDKVVIYKDGFMAGYDIQPTPILASHTANVLNSDKLWLRMTKEGMNTGVFYNNCMVSVNGYFHRIDYDINAIYVIDGNRSNQISGDAHLGIHSFHRIANINYHDIKIDKIYRAHANVPMSVKCIVQFDKPVNQETLILVIGGIAYYFDERIFRQIDDNKIIIYFEHIDLIGWFLEADKNIDLSSLPVTRLQNENSLITHESLMSDETIKAILGLSQSFVVGVESGYMYRDFITLEKPPAGNVYISANKPIWPIRTGGGRIAEYVYTEETPYYAIHTHKSIVNNFTYKTVSDSSHITISDHLVSSKPYDKAPARFEIIGASLT